MNASQRRVLLVGFGDGRRRAEHDDGAVVHRVLEDGAGEHDPVHEGDRGAGRDPSESVRSMRLAAEPWM